MHTHPRSNHAGKSRKREVIPDDELLYDPELDDEDERWVRDQRLRNSGSGPAIMHASLSSHDVVGPQSTAGRPKVVAEPNSDAILSCPACMHILSIDCQQYVVTSFARVMCFPLTSFFSHGVVYRHDLYTSQFRAMFVSNCVVVKGERLTFKQKKSRPGKKPKVRFALPV